MVPWTNICLGCRLRTQKWKSKDGAEREHAVPTVPLTSFCFVWLVAATGALQLRTYRSIAATAGAYPKACEAVSAEAASIHIVTTLKKKDETGKKTDTPKYTLCPWRLRLPAVFS